MAPDDLERVLRQAYEVIESACAELGADDDSVARELVAGARYALSVTVPPDSGVAAAVCGILAESARPELRVRLLCAPRAVPRVAELLGARCAIRVSDGPVGDMVVADGRAALVRQRGDGAGEVAGIHVPAVARSLEMFFAAAWVNAVPVAGRRMPGDHVRRILTELSTGVTDEQAAQRLGVSLRTYRRRVAEIMRWLGVGSRFQAGVRAAELGLLGGATR